MSNEKEKVKIKPDPRLKDIVTKAKNTLKTQDVSNKKVIKKIEK